MKIAIIWESPLEWYEMGGLGGGPLEVLYLVEGFKAKGWQVTLVIPAWIEYQTILDHFNENVYPDRVLRIHYPKSRFPYYRKFLELRKLMGALNGHDVIIRTGGNPPLLSHLSKVPYYMYVQTGNLLRSYSKWNDGSFLKRLYRLPLSSSYSKLDRVRFVSVSKFVKGIIDTEWAVNSDVIHPCIRVDKYSPLRRLKKDKSRIISIGRFSPEKNHLQQIDILKGILARGIQCTLTVIGTAHDPESNKVLRQLREKVKAAELSNEVRVLVNVSEKERKEELGRSGIFLHTCLIESFGLSILEAVASGCMPCIPLAGGVSEVLPSELTFSSAEEAVDIISRAITTSPQMNTLFDIVRNLDASNFQEKWINLIESHIGE